MIVTQRKIYFSLNLTLNHSKTIYNNNLSKKINSSHVPCAQLQAHRTWHNTSALRATEVEKSAGFVTCKRSYVKHF